VLQQVVLFELQFKVELLAGVKGAGGLDAAFLLSHLSPDFVVIYHANLGEAEASVGGAGKTLDVAVLRISEEDGSSGHRRLCVTENLALDGTLTEVLRLGDLRAQQG